MSHPNLLAISVGNSRTRVGAFVDGSLAASATHDNDKPERIGAALEEVYAQIHERTGQPALLASTHPDAAEQAERLVKQHLKLDTRRVERDVPIPIGRQLDPETLVGEDRLLNAAAAFGILQQACVVVDAGTALTVDFVDGAGTFHGGAILPGAQLQLEALAQRCAALPDVEFARPAETIGHGTAEAMLVGVYHGLRGAVHGLVEQYAHLAGMYPTVVVTGGDGDLLFRDDERVDRVVPDLTLIGLHTTFAKAVQ